MARTIISHSLISSHTAWSHLRAAPARPGVRPAQLQALLPPGPAPRARSGPAAVAAEPCVRMRASSKSRRIGSKPVVETSKQSSERLAVLVPIQQQYSAHLHIDPHAVLCEQKWTHLSLKAAGWKASAISRGAASGPARRTSLTCRRGHGGFKFTIAEVCLCTLQQEPVHPMTRGARPFW